MGLHAFEYTGKKIPHLPSTPTIVKKSPRYSVVPLIYMDLHPPSGIPSAPHLDVSLFPPAEYI